MHKEGHIGLTLLIFSIPSYILNFWNNYILIISVIFSVVPDYDLYLQKLRLKKLFMILALVSSIVAIYLFSEFKNPTVFTIPFFLCMLSLMSEHRTFSHTLVFAVICGIFMGFFTLKVFNDFSVGFFGAFLGVLSHIIGDLMTYKPFSPLYPFYRRKISFKLFKSSNPAVNTGFLILGLLALFIIRGGTILRNALDLVQ